MHKLLPYILIGSIVLSALGYVYWKGRTDKANAIKIETLEETVEDQESLNEIRNNRPDTSGLIDSLYSGTF